MSLMSQSGPGKGMEFLDFSMKSMKQPKFHPGFSLQPYTHPRSTLGYTGMRCRRGGIGACRGGRYANGPANVRRKWIPSGCPSPGVPVRHTSRWHFLFLRREMNWSRGSGVADEKTLNGALRGVIYNLVYAAAFSAPSELKAF